MPVLSPEAQQRREQWYAELEARRAARANPPENVQPPPVEPPAEVTPPESQPAAMSEPTPEELQLIAEEIAELEKKIREVTMAEQEITLSPEEKELVLARRKTQDVDTQRAAAEAADEKLLDSFMAKPAPLTTKEERDAAWRAVRKWQAAQG